MTLHSIYHPRCSWWIVGFFAQYSEQLSEQLDRQLDQQTHDPRCRIISGGTKNELKCDYVIGTNRGKYTDSPPNRPTQQ